MPSAFGCVKLSEMKFEPFPFANAFIFGCASKTSSVNSRLELNPKGTMNVTVDYLKTLSN